MGLFSILLVVVAMTMAVPMCMARHSPSEPSPHCGCCAHAHCLVPRAWREARCACPITCPVARAVTCTRLRVWWLNSLGTGYSGLCNCDCSIDCGRLTDALIQLLLRNLRYRRRWLVDSFDIRHGRCYRRDFIRCRLCHGFCRSCGLNCGSSRAGGSCD
ncbi:hypothetical protein F5Y18DRAFT_226724 [Xylariaceae sp. FL1019]|nr:hypothetical protein F5Y18DRAFT_226724 [Xylariaceae sp. FL1019]